MSRQRVYFGACGVTALFVLASGVIDRESPIQNFEFVWFVALGIVAAHCGLVLARFNLGQVLLLAGMLVSGGFLIEAGQIRSAVDVIAAALLAAVSIGAVMVTPAGAGKTGKAPAAFVIFALTLAWVLLTCGLLALAYVLADQGVKPAETLFEFVPLIGLVMLGLSIWIYLRTRGPREP
jgi:hypothetical protein